jgi:serine phosphatase RsbU (regulator of sigma subunit)
VLRIPLGIGARADRVLVLGWSEAPPETNTRMIALAQRFGDQLDLALTQARRREAQARAEELHRRFERSLLPKLSDGRSSLRIGLHYRPGEPHLELGGDFIDVLESPAGIAVIVGDVCGHGPDAAALGATLRTAWGALLMSGMEMNEVAAGLSLVLERERPSSDLFATALLAQIVPGENQLTLLNFGHPPPFLCHEGGAVPVAAPPHPPLGTFAGGQGQQLTMDLPPGWSLFFYTDGLVEARLTPSEGERFGEERLQKALQAFGCSFHDEDDLRRLMLAASDNGDVTVQDDVTVLVVAASEADALAKTAAGSRPEVTRLS